MPLPTERTVTGKYVNPVTGKPYNGTNGRNQYVTFRPYPSRWVDQNGDQILTGGGRVNLDADGSFTRNVVCTDVSGVLPEGRLWQLDQAIGGTTVTQYIAVPEGDGSPLDITDLLSVEIDGIQYVPVPGPVGPVGATGPTGAVGPEGPQPPLGAAGEGETIALRSTDPTTTNARTPLPHKASHTTGGSDVLAATDIGAESEGASTIAVAGHTAAVDPHGDRGWADSKFATQLDLAALDGEVNDLATSVSNLDGFVNDCLARVSAIEQGTAWLAGVNVAGGTVGIAGVASPPLSTPSGGGVLYAEAGELKWRSEGGVVTTIAPA